MPSSTDDDEGLIARASRGDQEAIAEYIRQEHAFLSRMARRIGSDVVDAEDLLSDAITSLLTLWRDGKGPVVHANAYVIQSMRNRVRDELRSPRSRVEAMPDKEPRALISDNDFRSVDIQDDRAVVGKALLRLSPAYRTALLETVVEGKKATDAAAAAGKSPNAYYVTLNRARTGFKRAILQELLENTENEICAEASQQLPKSIPDQIDDAPDDPSLTHISDCRECRPKWERYKALPALALLPLFALQAPAAPASAADASTSTAEEPGVEPDSSSAPSAEAPWSPQGAAGTLGRALGGLSRASRMTIAAASLVGAGVGITALGIGLVSQGAAARTQLQEGTASISLSAGSPQRSLTIDLRVPGASVTEATLRLELPNGVQLSRSPTGWDCSTSGQSVSCRSPEWVQAGLTLDVSADSVRQRLPIAVSLTGLSRGQELTGTARLPLQAEAYDLSVRATSS